MVINLVGIDISIPTLIWTLINFFLLFFVLNKFLFKPLTKFMDQRQARIDEGLKIRSDAEKACREEEERIQNEMNAVNNEGFDLIAQAKTRAQADMSEAVRDARVKAAEKFEASKEKLEKEKSISEEEIGSQIPEYARLLKNKLLEK